VAWLRLHATGQPPPESRVRLEYCPWIDAFQAEVWETLDPPEGMHHDIKVAAVMGRDSCITRVPRFNPALADVRTLRQVGVAIREDYTQYPSGFSIPDVDACWDNYYENNIQVPNTQAPSSSANTLPIANYLIDFQRAFFFANASEIRRKRHGMPTRSSWAREKTPGRSSWPTSARAARSRSTGRRPARWRVSLSSAAISSSATSTSSRTPSSYRAAARACAVRAAVGRRHPGEARGRDAADARSHPERVRPPALRHGPRRIAQVRDKCWRSVNHALKRHREFPSASLTPW
jgi:hypothetical protein